MNTDQIDDNALSYYKIKRTPINLMKFNAFKTNYIRPLLEQRRDSYGTWTTEYLDPELGEYPINVVVTVSTCEHSSDGYRYIPESKRIFMVQKDLYELYKS